MTMPGQRDSGRFWQKAQDFFAIFGPLTVITGLFYYFGLASAENFYDSLGVSLSVLTLPPAPSLSETADTVFRPLVTVLLCVVAVLLLQALLQDRIRSLSASWRA